MRGRGFEPLNPYGTRFPNTPSDVPELHVRIVSIRLAPLTWLHPLGKSLAMGSKRTSIRGLPPRKPEAYPARQLTLALKRQHKRDAFCGAGFEI